MGFISGLVEKVFQEGHFPIVLLGIALPVVWFIYMQSQKRPKVFGDLPPVVPYSIPFIGSMFEMGINPIAFLQKNYKEHGEIFTFIMWGRRMTYALGSEGNNLVFNAKHSEVNAEDAYNSLTVPVFGKEVIYDVPNSVLMEQKKFVKGGLTTEAFREYVGFIVEETVQFLNSKWKDQGTTDIQPEFATLTIMTASRCLMGKEIRGHLDESVAKWYHDLDRGFTPLNFLFPWLPLPSYWRRDAAQVNLRKLFLRIMKERRQNNDENNPDMLQALMSVTYKNGQKMSDLQVAHLMIALLMAGQHTSSTTSTWCLLELSKNPELRKALREEMDKVLQGKPLTFEALKELELLDSCIRETLRLHPPIISIMRKVTKPFKYKNYVIPAGDYLCGSPAISQIDPNVYENPMVFDPYRWVGKKDNEESSTVDYGFGNVPMTGGRSHYLPFGAGRHRCIGEQFAYVQLKTIIATVLQNFDIELDKVRGFPENDYTSMIVMPVSPCLVNYTRRSF